MRIILATVLSLGLVTPAVAQSDIGRMLQGLTTGNQNQDEALRQAYERGYRNGQQDAVRSRSSSLDRDRDPRSNYRDPSDRESSSPYRVPSTRDPSNPYDR